jgi:hypothetical protein
MNVRHSNESLQMEFANAVRIAVLGAITVGVLLVAAGTPGGAGVVSEAAAAAQPWTGQGHEYFPAGFPPPEGPVEPHIEAF